MRGRELVQEGTEVSKKGGEWVCNVSDVVNALNIEISQEVGRIKSATWRRLLKARDGPASSHRKHGAKMNKEGKKERDPFLDELKEHWGATPR